MVKPWQRMTELNLLPTSWQIPRKTLPACCGKVKQTTYLGLMKNLYWMSTVMRKKTTPSTAIANRFLPTRSHDRGDTKRFSPAKMRRRAQSPFQGNGRLLSFLPVELTNSGSGRTESNQLEETGDKLYKLWLHTHLLLQQSWVWACSLERNWLDAKNLVYQRRAGPHLKKHKATDSHLSSAFQKKKNKLALQNLSHPFHSA